MKRVPLLPRCTVIIEGARILLAIAITHTVRSVVRRGQASDQDQGCLRIAYTLLGRRPNVAVIFRVRTVVCVLIVVRFWVVICVVSVADRVEGSPSFGGCHGEHFGD
jgi:hypothetical protein